jgi:F-type H+-transporting ATPase subunit epsilon
MEKALQLDIVTPDKVVFSDQVQYVSARGVEGEFGVLPGHFQLLAALDIGCLHYTNLEGDKKCAFVGGGFAEVLDDKVTILAESSELAEDIDQARAMQARERAEKRLEHRTEEIDADRAQAALHRAITRIGAYSETH